MSEYDFVHKGALKLKGVSDGGVKKKKKKSKSAKRDQEEPSTSKAHQTDSRQQGEEEEGEGEVKRNDDYEGAKKFYAGKTKTEIAFLKRKEALDVDRIRKKASVSHKERVEKFNEYLNSLSEHYEPAKVSWTK